MKSKFKLKVGQKVEIEFWDHSYKPRGLPSSKRPFRFRVWGFVYKITSKEVILHHWQLQDKAKENVEFNSEEGRVLLADIIDVRFLGYTAESCPDCH